MGARYGSIAPRKSSDPLEQVAALPVLEVQDPADPRGSHGAVRLVVVSPTGVGAARARARVADVDAAVVVAAAVALNPAMAPATAPVLGVALGVAAPTSGTEHVRNRPASTRGDTCLGGRGRSTGRA